MQLPSQPSQPQTRKLSSGSGRGIRTSPGPQATTAGSHPPGLADQSTQSTQPSWEDLLVAAGLDRESRELTPAERWLADRAAEAARVHAASSRGNSPRDRATPPPLLDPL